MEANPFTTAALTAFMAPRFGVETPTPRTAAVPPCTQDVSNTSVIACWLHIQLIKDVE